MLLLKIAIFVFGFGSVILAGYELLPIGLEFLERSENKRLGTMSGSLEKMFLTISKKRLMLMGTVSFVIFAIAGFIISKSPIGAIIGSILGMFVPNILVKKMQDIRNNKFATQLVDGLMFLSASLKAGLSLLQALESLVEEMPAPISQEFGLVVKENRMGVPLEDCFLHLRERMANKDLHMVITAILVARETGGDLIDTFSQIVFTIREKTKIEGRVKTLCVQAKMQGVIMGILPIAFAIFIYKVNPANFEVLLKDRIGQMLLMYAAVSEIIGVFLIMKFSKIKF